MNMDEMDEWYYGMEDILVHNSNHYIKMLEESADKIGNFLYDYEKEI